VSAWQRTRYPGVYVRHRAGCAAPEGRCRCQPSYRVKYRRDGKPAWSPVMHDLAEARNWQTDNRKANAPAAIAARGGETLDALFGRFIDGARAGRIAQRNGGPYRVRTLDIYERDYHRHVGPTYGMRSAVAISALDWQLLVDDLARHGLKRNTLQTIFNAVRALYRWACAPSRRLLPLNATRGVELPAKDEVRRDRIASPAEAQRLLGALSEPCDRLDFALALYAGLRNMERAALGWADVSLPNGRIRVRRSKTPAGIRSLPIIGQLRPALLREWMRQGQPSTGRVVVGPGGGAVSLDKQRRRVDKAWAAVGLQRITPHEGRHTFASYMIAAGLNAKAVTVLMGHSSVQITFDRYGHLFPGHEDEAAGLLDAYLGVPEPTQEESYA
jgi:integrase